MPLLSDRDVLGRVLDHVAAGTTDEGSTWNEPVDHYLDTERFACELSMMRGVTMPFVPSAVLRDEGTYVARRAAGTPLLAVRGSDGEVRVFRNACRHRGATVATGTGCARAFVCGYHGWTYRLDGTLAGVPHRDGFPDLDVDGLVPVASVERHGFVFVNQDGSAQLDGTIDEIAGLVGSDLRLVGSLAIEEPVGWKVMAETFLEGYHIKSTHRQTFFPLQYDNLNVVETFGRHRRVTFPYQSVERLRGRDPSEWDPKGRVTFVYHLFPSVMVATFPDQVTVVTLDPIAVDCTEVTTYVLSAAARNGVGAAARESSGEPSLVAVGAAEDFQMARNVQAGLASGANTHLRFGRYESAIGHFHRTLDEALR
jgi:phenylpropionate dioxygenase-like ring-hydroxylating dioxygenase large terminal subunit